MILKTTTFNAGNQFNELVKENQVLTEQTHNNIEMIDKSAKSPDFIQNNKLPERKYTTTRTKSRNFLSNIAYVGINKDNFYREHFIFDVYLLVTKNLNPFSLDRKLDDKNKYEMIYMLWKECMQQAILRATSTVSLKLTRRSAGYVRSF